MKAYNKNIYRDFKALLVEDGEGFGQLGFVNEKAVNSIRTRTKNAMLRKDEFSGATFRQTVLGNKPGDKLNSYAMVHGIWQGLDRSNPRHIDVDRPEFAHVRDAYMLGARIARAINRIEGEIVQ